MGVGKLLRPLGTVAIAVGFGRLVERLSHLLQERGRITADEGVGTFEQGLQGDPGLGVVLRLAIRLQGRRVQGRRKPQRQPVVVERLVGRRAPFGQLFHPRRGASHHQAKAAGLRCVQGVRTLHHAVAQAGHRAGEFRGASLQRRGQRLRLRQRRVFVLLAKAASFFTASAV